MYNSYIAISGSRYSLVSLLYRCGDEQDTVAGISFAAEDVWSGCDLVVLSGKCSTSSSSVARLKGKHILVHLRQHIDSVSYKPLGFIRSSLTENPQVLGNPLETMYMI